MSNAEEVLHLNEHEAVRLLHEGEDELKVEGTWQPGGSPPPAHFHPQQDEYFEITSGSVTAIVDGEKRLFHTGDTLSIPHGTPHKMWNAHSETATATWHTRPAGRTASWFRTVDRLSDHGRQKPPLAAMARALTDYSDAFRLALQPKPLRPIAQIAFRLIGLAAR